MNESAPPMAVGSMEGLGLTLSAWLAERYESAQAIAARKTVSDKAEWLQDAAYFRAAYQQALEIERLRKALADVVDADWTYLGRDAATGDPNSLYCRVQRGRLALRPNTERSGPP